MVDWAHLGPRRFTAPFFAETIEQCLRHPADLLFRHQTPLDELGEIAAARASATPAGFIFHMSRCGSTLLAQMLAAAPENIVLSEPAPVDHVLRSHFGRPGVTEEQRVQWLRWLVAVMGCRRRPDEQHLFIKFDCWHVMFLPLIERAFPGVPWVFLYREPLEVMASAQKRLGAHMIPGVLEPEVFGWKADEWGPEPAMAHGARVLARLCEAALAAVQGGRGKLVNYRQLPLPLWPRLLEYWRVKYGSEAAARMLAVAERDAKNPVLRFVPDGQAKRDAITPELRALTHERLDEVYRRLEAQRRAGGFA